MAADPVLPTTNTSDAIQTAVDAAGDGGIVDLSNYASYNITNNTITVSKVMRRYIPIDDLWGLYGSLSPDYDGREEIRLFSEKWSGRFSQGEDAILPFGHDFARECKKLGFQMDCSEEFNHIYSNYFGNDNEELDKATFEISELDLLGSAAYSKWLLTTQKTYPYHLDEETCHWFTTILNQMEKLTR